MVCAIHGTGDLVSIVLMLDENSQKDILQRALDNERDLELLTGVHKHTVEPLLKDPSEIRAPG